MFTVHVPWAARPENKAARSQYMTEWRRSNPLKACIHTLVGGAKNRARKVGMEADPDFMTIHNILALVPKDMRCPCCAKKMVARVEQGKHPHSITLDRVNNHHGYIQGNVQVICATCNTRKRDMTVDDLQTLIRYIERHGS